MFDERDCVNKIIAGNMQAFDVLVKQYQNLVFTVLHRMLSNKEDLEDLSQEVFIKVYKNVKSFQFQSKLSTWIAKIAYLTAINHLKKYSKQNYNDYPTEIEEIHFTTETPEQLATKNDTTNFVNKLIEQLPVQYKTVITLFHINEFSLTEIVEITGMPEGTIKGYLFRARKLLKEQLEKHLKN